MTDKQLVISILKQLSLYQREKVKRICRQWKDYVDLLFNQSFKITAQKSEKLELTIDNRTPWDIDINFTSVSPRCLSVGMHGCRVFSAKKIDRSGMYDFIYKCAYQFIIAIRIVNRSSCYSGIPFDSELNLVAAKRMLDIIRAFPINQKYLALNRNNLRVNHVNKDGQGYGSGFNWENINAIITSDSSNISADYNLSTEIPSLESVLNFPPDKELVAGISIIVE